MYMSSIINIISAKFSRLAIYIKYNNKKKKSTLHNNKAFLSFKYSIMSLL